MKKYYIPTSSLNFNNIFSSESISPCGFYPLRKFGYSNCVSILENPLEGAILLYERLKSFARPISNVEDHPMVIEIETDETFPTLQDGVFYSTHTLYLDPWHTKVYFFTEQDKTIALSLSEHSLETKMLRLYKKRMIVYMPHEKYQAISDFDNISISNSEIEKDVITNKIKGLLYGYYIGAALSTSIENVKQIHALLEINDIVSAILSNPEKIANDSQIKSLSNYLSIINQTHPLYLALLQEVAFDNTKVNELIGVLDKYNVTLPFDTCRSILSSLKFESIENSSTISRISSKLNLLTKKSNGLLQTEAAEIVANELVISTLKCSDNIDKNLFILWINNILRTAKYKGKISPQKLEIASDLTRHSKEEYFKDEWEGSFEKKFLNGLRRHLNGEKFEFDYNNGLLSSLAAVLSKGDDWEQLLRFMRYKEMNDYRFAFALYGILNGFANLTRDFTDILLEQDSKYVTDIYTEFYGQLFNKTLDTSSKKQEEINITEHEISTEHSSKPDFYDALLLHWNMYKSKNKKDDITFKTYLDSCGDINTVQFLLGLKKEKGFKKGSAIKYIESFFNINRQTDPLQPTIQFATSECETYPTIPPTNQFTNSVLEDLSWIDVMCQTFIHNHNLEKRIRDNAQWLCEQYINTDGKYYAEHDKSNKRIIDHLRNLLIKKFSSYKKEIEDIYQFLLKQYGIK
ncbi:MAG: hypothetical protein IJX48_06520 [Paludibacteraceae bacterium]|nr:hypothetical protein [Paludibacteraceae bacterium]